MNLCCRAATGALERLQQEAFGATSLVPSPSSPIFMLPQGDLVLGVEHSASLEEKIAQGESGTGPSPVKLTANAKMSDRRT